MEGEERAWREGLSFRAYTCTLGAGKESKNAPLAYKNLGEELARGV